MRSVHQAHQRLELDFTDEHVTPLAGLAFVAQAAHRLGLLTAMDDFEPCKQRDRVASKLIYLVLREATRTWTGPLKDWSAAQREFAICFEDRFE